MRNIYVHNPHPKFEVPGHYDHEPPRFVKKLYNYARKRRVTMWPGFYTLTPINPRTLEPVNRQRHFNKHRARAMQAVSECIAYHLNLATGLSQISVEDMAKYCRLTTTSAAGNVSITRCSRAVIDLEMFGLLRCEVIFDELLGINIPKIIEVTSLFIEMCGLKVEEYRSAQNQQLGYQKRGLTVDEQEQLTLTEATRRAKERHRKVAFETRRKRHDIARIRKRAKRLKDQNLTDQRAEVLRSIVRRTPKHELKAMDHRQLDAIVTKELNYVLKLADDPPIH